MMELRKRVHGGRAEDKEASIAGAERTYDQAVASLGAQYGSASSNGDTGVEGATRRSAIKTRDAQYYAARDTSWANTLSASTTLGTSPWTAKAITAANAEAAHSTSRASAQAAHDAAMLDAIEDWQLSSRESLTDLLFTEGQSRESYNVATSNVYANWENGVANLLGDKPKGTGWGEDKDSVFNPREERTDDQQVNFKKPYTVDSPEHAEDESERAKSNWAWLQNWNRDRPRYPPRLGGEETTPYVGPSLEILNAHASAGNLQMEVATVDQKEIDVLYRNNLISPHAYFDAIPYLQHGPVRVAVSPQLKNGITAIEGPIKLAGLLEATGGAVEAGVGYCIVWTGVGTPAGCFLIAHGTDHLYAGSGSLYSGIHQKTFVVSGGEYFGKNALGLSDDGAVRFGRLVGFGSDFGAAFSASYAGHLLLTKPYRNPLLLGSEIWQPKGRVDVLFRNMGSTGRSVSAWNLNRFRLNSARFYTVQDPTDSLRLLTTGAPWPSEANRSALGTGVYSWGNKGDALRYLDIKKLRSPEVQILNFRVSTHKLANFRQLNVAELPNPSLWMNQNSKIWGGVPNHNLQYLTRPTEIGVEHFFHDSTYYFLVF